jgi:hypothetical protein
MAMMYISGPVLDGQTETKSSSMSMVGIGKQFKNNSTVRIFAFNPFASKFFDYQSTISNNSVYQRQNTYMKQSYGFMVMYAYSFKLGKSIERQKHNVEQQVQDNIIKMPMNF